MLVIFEGADGSGKTTLINQLLKAGVLDCKVTIPRGANYQKDMYSIMKKSPAICGADRSCISDIVYRTVDKQERDEVNLSSMIDILDSHDVKVIFCNTPKSFAYAQARGETFITDPKVHKRICQIYEDFMYMLNEYTNTRICTYDFTKDKWEDISEFIKEY